MLWRRKDGCEADIKGCGGCSIVKKMKVHIFYVHIILLQVCFPMAALPEKGTSMIALLGVWGCYGEVRMDVRQTSRGVGGVL